ncbi:MAG: tRNA (adenosine(37)-N6)-threonylcarbamoyltransferase complex dimerization subunit type 1 TsaB [Phyllobacterium sp.]
MIVLAIDTAANLCAAALFDADSNRILSQVTEDIGKGHAERLMALVEQGLAEAGLSIDRVQKIAVTVGPGSFTGARVGVSTARGLGLALGCPVVGITTLEALAHDTRKSFPHRPVLVAIDAHRGEVFAQFFGIDGTPESEPLAIEPAQLATQLESRGAGLVLAGSAAAMLNGMLVAPQFDVAPAAATGSIEAIAMIGAAREAGDKPKPLYLRAPDAKPQQGFTIARQGQ